MTRITVTLLCFLIWLCWGCPPARPRTVLRPLAQPCYRRSLGLLCQVGRVHVGFRVQIVALVR